jgi:hypothetical protein
MGPGQHLDRPDIGAVASDAAMVVPVGAHQVSQEFGVAGIGLGSRNVVAVAVAGRCQRVDREYLVAGRGQGIHPQATVGFDADRHLGGVLGMLGDQPVQHPNTGQALGQPPRRQPAAGVVHQIHVVMVFCPVVSDEQHRLASPWFSVD